MQLRITPETGPLPQSAEERVEIATILTKYAPPMSGSFDTYGVFTLRYWRLDGEWKTQVITPGLSSGYNGREVQVPFWSPRLAEIENPAQYTLKLEPHISSQPISAVGVDGTIGLKIEDIRLIDRVGVSSGFYTVGSSGYLLRHEPGSEFWNTPHFERSDLSLAKALRGEDPEYYNNSWYKRPLEQGLKGQRVLCLELTRPKPVFLWEKEAPRPNSIILLSSPTRLVPWDQEKPLAYDGWRGSYRGGIWSDITHHPHVL